jgi:hypothetical protein
MLLAGHLLALFCNLFGPDPRSGFDLQFVLDDRVPEDLSGGFLGYLFPVVAGNPSSEEDRTTPAGHVYGVQGGVPSSPQCLRHPLGEAVALDLP